MVIHIVKGFGIVNEVEIDVFLELSCFFDSESEVTQSCLTLCDPMDCSLPGSSVHGIFQAIVNSIGVDCHFLLQGIFPTQGSNPGHLHCRQMLYRLSHQGDDSSPFERVDS